MCHRSQWQEMIRAAQNKCPEPIRLLTPLLRVKGRSRAVIAECDDGSAYVVKGGQNKRPLIAEHVVALMGLAIGAPVPTVRLVDVPRQLILAGTFLGEFDPGIGNGSRFVEGCADAREVRHPKESSNRQRYAALAVLFGWADCDDVQFLVSNIPPHEVWGIDFGHFFCGGEDWNLETLGNAPNARIHHLVASYASLSESELQSAVAPLLQVSDSDVAGMVAAPPETWDISFSDRVGLAQYIAGRRDQLLASYKLI